MTRVVTLGPTIREWRRNAGLSQAELAERLGTSQPAVSRWEAGHDEPRLSSLAAIARECGLRLVVGAEPDVDRAQIRHQLTLTPRQRLESVANVHRFMAAARKGR